MEILGDLAVVVNGQPTDLTGASQGSMAVRVVCQRLLQPTGHSGGGRGGAGRATHMTVLPRKVVVPWCSVLGAWPCWSGHSFWQCCPGPPTTMITAASSQVSGTQQLRPRFAMVIRLGWRSRWLRGLWVRSFCVSARVSRSHRFGSRWSLSGWQARGSFGCCLRSGAFSSCFQRATLRSDLDEAGAGAVIVPASRSRPWDGRQACGRLPCPLPEGREGEGRAIGRQVRH
jgi:hypothetical protein